jgi:hypothetical protein
MKLTPLVLALAFGATSLAGPSFAAPSAASTYQAAEAGGTVIQIAHKKDQRVKIRKPERPRCFAWPGGCTNVQ